VYLHSPPQPTPPSESDDKERIRARVFTPPPKFSPRESTPPASRRTQVRRVLCSHTISSDCCCYRQSRTDYPSSVFSDSPESLPPRSISSMSNRGRVPFTLRSAYPEMSSPEPISSPSLSSSKVPFGFRSEVHYSTSFFPRFF
jgi:hypothetical protein